MIVTGDSVDLYHIFGLAGGSRGSVSAIHRTLSSKAIRVCYNGPCEKRADAIVILHKRAAAVMAVGGQVVQPRALTTEMARVLYAGLEPCPPFGQSNSEIMGILLRASLEAKAKQRAREEEQRRLDIEREDRRRQENEERDRQRVLDRRLLEEAEQNRYVYGSMFTPSSLFIAPTPPAPPAPPDPERETRLSQIKKDQAEKEAYRKRQDEIEKAKRDGTYDPTVERAKGLELD